MNDLTKRFYVFTYSDYYPSGGLSDITATFDSLEESIQAIKKAIEDEKPAFYVSSDNCYVFDKEIGSIVYDHYSR